MAPKDTRVAAYVAVADRLPTLPTVALEIVNLSRREDLDMYDLAVLISRDPAMSARVMRLANSALYKRRHEISTVRDAVLTLGSKAVKLAALSFALTSVADPAEDLVGYDIALFWRRALIQSVVARTLCTELGLTFTEEAATGALLMDLSVPVLVRIGGEDYRDVVRTMKMGHPDWKLEQDILGVSHVDLGRVLMNAWSLPSRLADAVAHHHVPERLEGGGTPDVLALARVLNLAHRAATFFMVQEPALLKEFEDALEAWFHRDATTAAKILGTLDAPIKEFAQIVRVEFDNGSTFAEILEMAREQLLSISMTAAKDLEESEEKVAALTKVATLDALSGLGNRRALDDVMTREWLARANQEFPDPLGVLMIDIDRFKSVNDTWGHAAGDRTIQSTADAIRTAVRASDSVYRWGGEEFVVLAPGASGASLRALGERVRRMVEKTVVDIGGRELRITVSVGTAAQVTDPAGREPSTLFKAADVALYRAKQSGRNRVEQGPEQ